MPTHYTLHLSGLPQVIADDVVIHGFEFEKDLALLAYLALIARPVNRDHLAGLFWGELDAERSRGNLHRVLHNLTHRLPGCLEVERHSVRFANAQAVVAVHEFRRWRAAGAAANTRRPHHERCMARSLSEYRRASGTASTGRRDIEPTCVSQHRFES